MARPSENLDLNGGETLALFAGNANPTLAQDVAKHLNTPLGRAYVGRFSDGEVNVELMENVRGRDVFIMQPTCPPANDNLWSCS
jgi:ribose-phosphate pyrophosphokinase